MGNKNLGTIQLETERLILRKFVDSDIEFLHNNCFSRDPVTKYVTWKYERLEDTRDLIKGWMSEYVKDTYYHWCIELKATHEPIGSIELRPEGHEAEIGYRIGDKWWNHGYATEAFKEVIKFAFDTLGIQEISIDHHIENDASGKVALKNGFKFVGVIHNGREFREGWRDIKKYTMTKEEYDNINHSK